MIVMLRLAAGDVPEEEFTAWVRAHAELHGDFNAR